MYILKGRPGTYSTSGGDFVVGADGQCYTYDSGIKDELVGLGLVLVGAAPGVAAVNVGGRYRGAFSTDFASATPTVINLFNLQNALSLDALVLIKARVVCFGRGGVNKGAYVLTKLVSYNHTTHVITADGTVGSETETWTNLATFTVTLGISGSNLTLSAAGDPGNSADTIDVSVDAELFSVGH